MGNQHSSSSSNPSPHHGKSESSHSSRSSRTRGSSQSYHRFFHPSSSGGHSESSSTFDYTLTPTSSLSPSLTRIETQHHYDHKHGSSLDSYVAQVPGEPSFDPLSPGSIAMGAAASAEKLPKQRSGNKDQGDGGSPHAHPVPVPARTKSQSKRYREGTPHNDGSPGMFRPPGPPPSEPAPRERESVSSVSSSYAGAQPIFTHPPRLPLPIQEEELAPGSPVLQGAIPGLDPADDELSESDLKHNKSLLSQITAEDEDEDDEDRRAGPPVDPVIGATRNYKHHGTVPTEITWRGHGDKIYVTGTFANWSKKFRMQYDPATGMARTTLDLIPGTHHLRFIVDGEMTLSDDLPTAVDYTITLVNYIEVPADAAFRPGGLPAVEEDQITPAVDTVAPPDVHPPLVLPIREPDAGVYDPKPILRAGTSSTRGYDHDHASSTGGAMSSTGPASEAGSERLAKPEFMDLPPRHYGQVVPTYLSDLDRDERSARFARASSRVSEMAPPPTLPGFLVKSILNMQTPAKDDGSVLNMPNHTMLNHLATSSIRQGVLTTSMTTRYRRKYVTLIMYRPTTLDE